MSEELIKRLRLKAEVLAGLRDATASLLTQAADALSRPAPAVQVPDAVAVAYGLLWHVNAGLDAPHGTPSLTPEKAAYEARKLLRDLMTKEQRGDGINAAREHMLAAAPAPATVAPNSNVYGPGSATSPAAAHMLATGAFPATVAAEAVAQEAGAVEWMKRTAISLGVADADASLLELARGLTGWIDRARATFDEYQDRALKAERERDALMKAVAQGGGVDVEKVMALVEEYGRDCYKAGASRWPAESREYESCAAEELKKIRALLSTSPAGVGGWIPVSERLPEAGKGALAYYKNSHGYGRIVRAFYAPKHTLEANSYDDDGQFDYDEATDTAYLPEGWLEKIDNWGDFSSIYIVEGEVTHWRPLPSAPAIANKEPK